MAEKNCCPSQGADAVILLKAGTGVQDFTTGTVRRLLFENWGVRPEKELTISDAAFGNRERHVNQARQTIDRVRGTATIRPSWNDIEELAPLILGATKVGDIWTPGGGPPGRFGAWADTVGDIFQFDDLQVNQATFTGRSGEALLLELDILGRTWAQPLTSTPSIALTTTDADQQLIFAEATLTKGSDTYCFADFRLVINNNLDPKFYNAKTAKCVAAGVRASQASFTMPWNSDIQTDWFGSGSTGDAAAGVAATIDFAHGGGELNTIFHLAALKWGDRGPSIQGTGDIDFGIDAEVFATSTFADVRITNSDSTP